MYTHDLKWSVLNSAKEISKTNPLNVLTWEERKTQLILNTNVTTKVHKYKYKANILCEGQRSSILHTKV